MKPWIIVAICAAALTAAAPAQAQISASLARQCREMMLKAYPTAFYGERGTAALQREYFRQCIERQGKMDDRPEPAGSGSGNGSRP